MPLRHLDDVYPVVQVAVVEALEHYPTTKMLSLIAMNNSTKWRRKRKAFTDRVRLTPSQAMSWMIALSSVNQSPDVNVASLAQVLLPHWLSAPLSIFKCSDCYCMNHAMIVTVDYRITLCSFVHKSHHSWTETIFFKIKTWFIFKLASSTSFKSTNGEYILNWSLNRFLVSFLKI